MCWLHPGVFSIVVTIIRAIMGRRGSMMTKLAAVIMGIIRRIWTISNFGNGGGESLGL